MSCFVNIFWKSREHFTIGGFREGRSGYTKYNFCFALFRILEECYFINMRICLHRWEWMDAGFFSQEKCLRLLFLCVSKL